MTDKDANPTPADAEAGEAAGSQPQPNPESQKKSISTTKVLISIKRIRLKHMSAFLSFFSFVLSLPLLAGAIWLLYMKGYDCEGLLRLPQIQVAISVGLMSVFVLSNVALFLRSRVPMAGFLVVVVPLLMLFVVGLGFVGAYTLESHRIPASPMWFRKKVFDNSRWIDIKSCVYASGVCVDLERRSLETATFMYGAKELSPIEYGCCRPPESCDMEAQNATFWSKVGDEGLMEEGSDGQTEEPDVDCDLWRNGETTLCFNCVSCREGFIKTLRNKWWKLGVFLVVMAVLLTISHLSLFAVSTWQLLVP